jgi:hypothetical protein
MIGWIHSFAILHEMIMILNEIRELHSGNEIPLLRIPFSIRKNLHSIRQSEILLERD